MKSFYQFMMRYRGNKQLDDARRLADWMFYDHDFPKHSQDYYEISSYIEWHIPFPEAIATYDHLWDEYIDEVKP
ncbi:YozE family protein [Gracilibacillus salitolerans]|uniref:YozE family protein n=1 Tax=Gracilibacillus salitolerans TaxID=2663022 RepID=A0A5Q2TKR6_9BACI|nr:YozE family protein [Gracilibacillus salitolerans]QGH34731.1 YozE family protein [Gracilibacillus salitolerans]